MTGREAVNAPASRGGFTLMEVMLAMALLAVVSAIAIPPIGRLRNAAAVQNARYVVVATAGLARATAIRFGRPATLRIDAADDRIWVETDTTVEGAGSVLDTLGLFHIGDELNVDIGSNRSAICFDGRGVGTTGTVCPDVGAEIVLSRLDRADTVRMSSVGRVLP